MTCLNNELNDLKKDYNNFEDIFTPVLTQHKKPQETCRTLMMDIHGAYDQLNLLQK